MAVSFIESSRLPTAWGEFDIHGFEDTEFNKEHIVLTMGDDAVALTVEQAGASSG